MILGPSDRGAFVPTINRFVTPSLCRAASTESPPPILTPHASSSMSALLEGTHQLRRLTALSHTLSISLFFFSLAVLYKSIYNISTYIHMYICILILHSDHRIVVYMKKNFCADPWAQELTGLLAREQSVPLIRP